MVVRFRDGGPHVLVIRDPYKNWGLPKGHIEDSEEEGETAIREVREETGLEDLQLGEKLGTIDWWFRNDGRRIHKFCTFFLMRSRQGQPVPEKAEGISECVWMPLQDAPDRITYDNAREMVREAVRRWENRDTALFSDEELGG